MLNARIAIRRKEQFRDEEAALLVQLNQLEGVSLQTLQLFNLYDIFQATPEELHLLESRIARDAIIDDVVPSSELDGLATAPHLAIEFLPGQYDQRADAAMQALALLSPNTQATITSAQLLVFSAGTTGETLALIKNALINPVEAREKDLALLELAPAGKPQELATFADFLELDSTGLEALRTARGMAMSLADLQCVQDYFRSENRVPTEVELAALDTYWSDHCRHTTFGTELTDIEIDVPRFQNRLENLLKRWYELRDANGRTEKPLTLMDLGTIMGRELRRTGALSNQEVSEEINACSVYVDAETETGNEPWLLMFKNETHNHPTEIEPFGGASTCLGGAIRDPLSGRSWVYQALRLSGAADITTPRSQTREGKLPQSKISTRATAGYSSYGNQIGLATTHVREYIHPGYEAKRMELGAVVAAAPVENVRREEPRPGDVIVILGGRTGRDGIGGATGSSKSHTEESLAVSGAEVQKGNPVNERKIQRLFRKPEVAKLIRRCNDFGAGGVSVAVGELADSLDIHLDRVPLKYSGLNPLEIAISESQERMAVVLDPADVASFIAAAEAENIEAIELATVTDTGRLRMFHNDKLLLDLSREFLNTNGARREQKVRMIETRGSNTQEADGVGNPAITSTALSSAATADTPDLAAARELLRDFASSSQEGMVEQFDASIGRSTVLMPYGGKFQKSEEAVSAQTLPTSSPTLTTSVMAAGFSPALADNSPYLMGTYSVVEALARLAAAGVNTAEAWLTVQEYFPRQVTPEDWGTTLQALLGLLEAQDEFQVAAIGGKDSMSGSYGEDLHVPPTLVTFGVGLCQAEEIRSATLPELPADLYLLAHNPLADGVANYSQLRENFAAIHAANPELLAAIPVGAGGIIAALAKAGSGNRVDIQLSLPDDISAAQTEIGGIIFAIPQGAAVPEAFTKLAAAPILLGHAAPTSQNSEFSFTQENTQWKLSWDEIEQLREEKFAQVYPLNKAPEDSAVADALPTWAVELAEAPTEISESQAQSESLVAVAGSTESTAAPTPLPVHVLLPVFPGTNSEYDTAQAFEAAGATTEFHVIRNLNSALLAADTTAFIEKLAKAEILAISGGFSLGDEPDGSAKFIANFLRVPEVAAAVKEFIARDGLVLGICNGFQALVKSGFLPYGDPDQLTENSPTLRHNAQLRHVSRIATTRVASVNSPWLSEFTPGQLHRVPVSHGEGRFSVNAELAQQLFANGQVAFQYVDHDGEPTLQAPENPNGSNYAIEGIISPCGRILGKMGHPERYRPGLMKNIPEIGIQDIFGNAVRYCQNRK